MADIRSIIPQLPEQEKGIAMALIDFYETMKGLENDPERGGKQATQIVMTISDIEKIFNKD